jgi:hypothetical protein
MLDLTFVHVIIQIDPPNYPGILITCNQQIALSATVGLMGYPT